LQTSDGLSEANPYDRSTSCFADHPEVNDEIRVLTLQISCRPQILGNAIGSCFMPLESFTGTWIFDSENSQLTSSSPLHWVQLVNTTGGRIQVHEEITRSTGLVTTNVDASPDGKFYPVNGSPIADEISYTIEGCEIIGIGRKAGAISLREKLSLVNSDKMTMGLTVIMNGKEIYLGVAHFKREMKNFDPD